MNPVLRIGVALLLTAGFRGMICPTAGAEVPDRINIQGRLTDSLGAVVADRDYSVTFSIYADSSGESAIWSSGARTVTVTGGLFNYCMSSNKVDN